MTGGPIGVVPRRDVMSVLKSCRFRESGILGVR